MLDDWRSAPLDPQTRAALALIETMTLEPETLNADSFTAARAAGLADDAIEDALHVAALFAIYTRLADSLGFDIPPADAFSRTADMLLKRGYK